MSAAPDVKSLTKWEDAFAYPIPQVRVLERQLRADLVSNKEKLRALVGESYRDLLRTAETIIEMDKSAQKVEELLGETSRNCNSRLLEKKADNLRDFEEKVGAKDREKYIFAAQLAILQSCPSVVSRLLHKGGSCLLAAKVFVVSRLLLKSLSQNGPLPLLEFLRVQLTTLRTTLLHHIDLRISTPTFSSPHLISALASFSLLKTSPPTEVLRHFLFIRSATISSILNESAVPTPEAVLKSLELFNKSLADAEEVFPRRISEALVALKSKGLFIDPEVLSVPELSLDVNGCWLPEEIRGFVPWVRHDDLEKARVVELVKAWASREVEILNKALERALGAVEHIQQAVKLRGDVLRIWRGGRKGRGRLFEGGEKFREIFNERLTQVVREHAQGVKQVGEILQDLVTRLDGGNADSVSLWSDSLLSMGLSNGAFAFKEAVQDRVHGRNTTVKRFRQVYDRWLHQIEESATIIRELRNSSSDSQDEDEDFDVEEERTQEGVEDSDAAENELVSWLEKAYKELEEVIGGLASSSLVDEGEKNESTLQATFLLRVIRQVRQNPVKLGDEVFLPLSWFGTALVPKLHSVVALGVCKNPLDKVGALLRKRKWSGTVASKALWEGDPQLPVQPSPLVFKFLRDLVTAMSTAGDDIWTPAAVKCVKGFAIKKLWTVLGEVLDGRTIAEEASINGRPSPEAELETNRNVENMELEVREQREDGEEDKKDESNSPTQVNQDIQKSEDQKTQGNGVEPRTISRDWAIQLVFDTLYLDEALHRKGERREIKNKSWGIVNLAGRVEAAVGSKLELEEDCRRRLEGGAREYWKRTCLLFALLA